MKNHDFNKSSSFNGKTTKESVTWEYCFIWCQCAVTLDFLLIWHEFSEVMQSWNHVNEQSYFTGTRISSLNVWMEAGFHVLKQALRVLTSKCFLEQTCTGTSCVDGGVGGGGQPLNNKHYINLTAATPVCSNTTQTLSQGKNISQKTYLAKTKENGIQTCPKILEGHPDWRTDTMPFNSVIHGVFHLYPEIIRWKQASSFTVWGRFTWTREK